MGKAIDNLKGAEREVIGISKRRGAKVFGKPPLTAPATPEAAQWEGWGTALKPAAEDWWLMRKPFKGSVAENVLEYATGAINIDINF